jgi:phosphoribosyl-ATP pyrophosphohydrolase
MPADAADSRVLERLFAVIESRRGADPHTSYTARLFSKGLARIARKAGEEAIEVVVAALAHRERLAAESADLLYHLLVLWAAAGLRPADVWEELSRREGTSGIAEKSARPVDDSSD